MPKNFRIVILLAAVVASIAVASLAVISVAQQRANPAQPAATSYRAPRLSEGHPDLNGIWQAMVTANWDLQDHDAQPGPHPEIMGAYGGGPAGQSIVEGG